MVLAQVGESLSTEWTVWDMNLILSSSDSLSLDPPPQSALGFFIDRLDFSEIDFEVQESEWKIY